MNAVGHRDLECRFDHREVCERNHSAKERSLISRRLVWLAKRKVSQLSNCPIWGTPAMVDKSGDLTLVNSVSAGGEYQVTGTALAVLPQLEPPARARVTTWLVNQRRLGESCPRIDSEFLTKVELLPPLRVQDRLDRVLLWRESLGDRVGQKFRFAGTQDKETAYNKASLRAWTESVDFGEGAWLLTQQVKLDLLNFYSPAYEVSLKGWLRLEELRSRFVRSSQAFVAMWFHSDTALAYSDGIEPAIVNCGYTPLRIDKKEHSNKIDDEIVAEIRRSRFLVADFTSEPDRARGGVYFEAGLALGLNLPVIWTCRKDLLSQVHFDTRQFNHIDWKEPSELRDRLCNRIKAVLGEYQGSTVEAR